VKTSLSYFFGFLWYTLSIRLYFRNTSLRLSCVRVQRWKGYLWKWLLENGSVKFSCRSFVGDFGSSNISINTAHLRHCQVLAKGSGQSVTCINICCSRWPLVGVLSGSAVPQQGPLLQGRTGGPDLLDTWPIRRSFSIPVVVVRWMGGGSCGRPLAHGSRKTCVFASS
jgi:hypothetical protein